MKNKGSLIKKYIAFILLLGLTVISYMLYFDKMKIKGDGIFTAALLYFLSALLGMYIIKLKTGSYISLMTFFWISFILFHGSQVILYLFDLTDFSSYNIFKIYKSSAITKATLYTAICALAFCFGMSLNKVKSPKEKNVDEDAYLYVLRKFAKVLIIVSVLPFVYYISCIFRVGITQGYAAINDFSNYVSSNLIKLVLLFVKTFVVGSFLAMMSYYNNKRIYRFFIGVIVCYSILLLSLGERTEPTSLILLILWLDNYLCTLFGKKAKTGKKKLFAFAVVCGLVLVFPSIMALRHSGIITVSSLVETVQKKGVIESFKESVAGIGYSIVPLIEVRHMVAEGEPLRYGTTYLAASTNIIPYLGIAKKYASLSTWLMKEMHIEYGPGFSMAAEAYLNFGNYPISLILFGYLFSKVTMWKSNELSVKRTVRGMIFIITCLTMPRRELSSQVRELVYLVALLPWLINRVYDKKRRKD